MPQSNTDKGKSTPRTNAVKTKTKSARSNPFQLRETAETATKTESLVHFFKAGEKGELNVLCDTDDRGQIRPRGKSVLEIVVDSTEGFIPLWAKDTTLRWRFQERSMRFFANPAAAKTEIRKLLGEAILAWGDAAPVKFAEREDAWDFEVVMRETDRCSSGGGCVLASAFFPDSGRHELRIYPKMFSQTKKEQIDTFIHEIGHVFGLRHFFAKISETPWASEIFGTHKPFSIMNYGGQSELTPEDRNDLKLLYQKSWGGELSQINGTPIRLMKPFHDTGSAPESMFAVGLQTVFQPQSKITYTG